MVGLCEAAADAQSGEAAFGLDFDELSTHRHAVAGECGVQGDKLIQSTRLAPPPVPHGGEAAGSATRRAPPVASAGPSF